MFGDVLQKQVEDRLKFYDSGALPPKNAEIMADAVLKAEEAKNEIIKKEKKKKEKKKSKKAKNGEEAATNGVETHMEEMSIKEESAIKQENTDEVAEPKKKKKKKNKENIDE